MRIRMLASLVLAHIISGCAKFASFTVADASDTDVVVTADVLPAVDVLSADDAVTADVRANDVVDAAVTEEDDVALVDVASPDVSSTDTASTDTPDAVPDVVDMDGGVPCVSTLTIAPEAMPPSTVLVAGNVDWWYVMASYRATATCTDQVVDLTYINSFGDAASFAQVAAAADGRTIGTGVLGPGENSGVNVMLTTPLVVTAGSSRIIQLWAHLATVVPRASVSTTSGVPLSGARVALGIGNIHVTEAVSHAEISPDISGVHIGNQFIVRRSKPTVLPLELPTTQLMPGVLNTLYYERIGSDLAGPIRWRKDTFQIDHPSSIRLGGCRITRNEMEVPSTEYEIVDQDDRDLRSSTPPIEADTFYLTLRWLNEEDVSRAGGNTYALQCVPQGGAAGDAIRVQPVRLPVTAGKPMVTGHPTEDYLSSFDTASGIRFPGPNLYTVGAGSIVTAAFLWTDNSEVPHTRDSLDWANGVFIIDRAVARVLVVP